MALITLAQQQAIKPISDSWGRKTMISGGITQFERIAEEVEELDLRKYIGDEFITDLQVNGTSEANAALLNGGVYVKSDGSSIAFKGLRSILAYLIYRSYIVESRIADTFTGAVMQKRNETEFAHQGDIKKIQSRMMEIADKQFELIRDYLNQNSASYPYWQCAVSHSPRFPKMYGVRKTSSKRRYENID